MDEKIEELAKEIQCSQEEENCFYCKRRASCCVGFDIALKVIKAGYRKEIDTAREILTLIKNGVELNSMIDGDAKIAIMNELRWAGQRYGIDFTNSLEKGGEKNGKTSSRS